MPRISDGSARHRPARAAARPLLAEPCFEVLPRLVASPERRLTQHAAAALSADGAAYPFRDNAVTLVRDRSGALAVTAAGAGVVHGFALPAGPLTRVEGSLGAAIGDACDRACVDGEVTPFEAVVATPTAACVLLRGVVLPTADGAEVVLSWKQVLDDDATARLRAELLRELRPRDRRVALVNVFA